MNKKKKEVIEKLVKYVIDHTSEIDALVKKHSYSSKSNEKLTKNDLIKILDEESERK